MIADFLAQNASRPFVWGKTDCVMCCADLWAAVTGVDPASHLRGSYASWMEARRVQMQHGGLERLCRSCMDRAGVAASDKPIGQGVAVIRAGKVVFAAIIYRGRAHIPTDNGWRMFAEFDRLAEWDLCPRL